VVNGDTQEDNQKAAVEPTPESVQQAEVGAWSNFTPVLTRAQALGAQGKHAECMDAPTEARRIPELN
jgi:hypothetical protein